ncbi:ATP-dependent DNA helicase [Bacilli bacterium]|uniref:ATP-dependent DNA helicase n=1 Tax=Oceanobacillus caeni TaxID=405946 RepID=UPI000622B3A8|nr:ATP-dependent DNA helicase [Oceanobacillus caeni]KKE79268.1 ATP-dependent helicase [Bacilli bacterium VT-13-104]PZD86818.1 ATP-dependent DNA helicase [Bacilli bacterium]MBU8790666.1 ATP-dependent DNA helicase [Oceanobacillus caeni]PZD88192.1 ATP-dependent DNA helicase [Bacilli bacterium]PZD91469.1 ATP-dependent DNA helicase [Bacilli bacterium]
MTRNQSLPFTVSKTENFFERLGDYVGDVFYDILPEQGYELRDEQIYMAFQLEQAFKNKRAIFAEAGVGTGKTFVYLIYAICYARYMGRPAIISCADETLIEQLVKKGGDIEKLEKALGINVDVRLAKSREQYVCVRKLDALIDNTDDEDIMKVYDAIPEFVFDSKSKVKTFERYGDRKEYPWVSDETWEKIAWDPLQQCPTCEWRHRSGQTLNREYYRHASDIIICSHDFYMEHIWTKESRKREGQLPLLPEASSVIFDEGHLLEFAAQKGLTYRYNLDTITKVLTGYIGQDVREESLLLVEDILMDNDILFDKLADTAHVVEGSNRQEITLTKEILEDIKKLDAKVNQLLEELVFDSELFTIDDYYIKIIEEFLEFFSNGLRTISRDDEGIYWLEEIQDTISLVIMPRLVEDVLKKEVFTQKIPFVFSSATLSHQGDFSYIAKSLGIENVDSFSVASPFDYERQMQIFGSVNRDDKWDKMISSIIENNGGSLLLFSSREEMDEFRRFIHNRDIPFTILFEGDQEISEMVRRFQVDETAVLCSYHLWEGLDVPGKSLTQVIISSLPFPPNDPVFKAKRKHAKDPEKEVDLPYMLLRLRQGIGRLIRTSEDSGIVHIWMSEDEEQKYLQEVKAVLPVEIKF